MSSSAVSFDIPLTGNTDDEKQTKGHQEETDRQTKVRYSAENLTLSLTETKKKVGGYARNNHRI